MAENNSVHSDRMTALSDLRSKLARFDARIVALTERIHALPSDDAAAHAKAAHELVDVERDRDRFCSQVVRSILAAPTEPPDPSAGNENSPEVLFRSVELRVETSAQIGYEELKAVLDGERVTIVRDAQGKVWAIEEPRLDGERRAEALASMLDAEDLVRKIGGQTSGELQRSDQKPPSSH